MAASSDDTGEHGYDDGRYPKRLPNTQETIMKITCNHLTSGLAAIAVGAAVALAPSPTPQHRPPLWSAPKLRPSSAVPARIR